MPNIEEEGKYEKLRNCQYCSRQIGNKDDELQYLDLLENQWHHLKDTPKCRNQEERKQEDDQIYNKLIIELERRLKDTKVKIENLSESDKKVSSDFSNSFFYFLVLFTALLVVLLVQDPQIHLRLMSSLGLSVKQDLITKPLQWDASQLYTKLKIYDSNDSDYNTPF